MAHDQLRPIPCGRCGKMWNPATDDLVELFNHGEVHRWLDRDRKGKTEWSVRHGWDAAYVMAWAELEADEIERRMDALGVSN